MLMLQTGIVQLDARIEEALSLLSSGGEREALIMMIGVLADTPVHAAMEPEKRKMIAEMRAYLAGVPQ